jgi:hypothetical protein
VSLPTFLLAYQHTYPFDMQLDDEEDGADMTLDRLPVELLFRVVVSDVLDARDVLQLSLTSKLLFFALGERFVLYFFAIVTTSSLQIHHGSGVACVNTDGEGSKTIRWNAWRDA